jgi:Tat protein translocase TatB subunit
MGAMFGIGPQELLVIMIVGLLVLGPKRLPEIARSLGRGMAEFRRASSDLRQSLSLEDESTRNAPPPRAPAQAGGHADTPESADSLGDETAGETAGEDSNSDAAAGVPIGSASADSDPAEGRTIAPPAAPTNEKTPSGG